MFQLQSGRYGAERFGKAIRYSETVWAENRCLWTRAKPEGLIQANKCVGVVYEDPIEVSNKVAALLKEKGCDLVVCLSHLGIQMDRELVAKTRNIDVILGGHSHTFMKGPENYQNVDGKEVPLCTQEKWSSGRSSQLDFET